MLGEGFYQLPVSLNFSDLLLVRLQAIPLAGHKARESIKRTRGKPSRSEEEAPTIFQTANNLLPSPGF